MSLSCTASSSHSCDVICLWTHNHWRDNGDDKSTGENKGDTALRGVSVPTYDGLEETHRSFSCNRLGSGVREIPRPAGLDVAICVISIIDVDDNE